MARSNDFALRFLAAHAEVGLTRVPISHILQRIDADPAFLFTEEFAQLGGQCPVHPETHQEDLDKVMVNTLLTYLFRELARFMAERLPISDDGRVLLARPPESALPLDPADPVSMAAAKADMLCPFLRDCTCHLLDSIIAAWMTDVIVEEERCRQDPENGITGLAAANYLLRHRMEESHLYRRPGYDPMSITKTGSHTAIHVCWSLLESAPRLVPGQSPDFYEDLVRRSLKQIVPLSMGSLGMLVNYMDATGIEAEDHLAIHMLPAHQTAFVLEQTAQGPIIHLNPDVITPFKKPHERYYTGCPAFYVTGMIPMYLEICLMIARQNGVWEKLVEA